MLEGSQCVESEPARAHEALEAGLVEDLHEALAAAAGPAAAAGATRTFPAALRCPGLVKGLHAGIHRHVVVRTKDVGLQLCGRRRCAVRGEVQHRLPPAEQPLHQR